MASVTPFRQESVNGFLHIPSEPLQQGLVLTHGAGTDCQSPLLIAVANAFASGGIHVLRCDLQFRRNKRFGPPSPAQSAGDRIGLRDAVAAMRRIVTGRLLLGGHSYGGRQASILASEDSSIAGVLLLLSYPLHPPNSPDKLRTGHFSQLAVPSLFVHGTQDPFGTVDEVQAAIRLIPARTEISIVQKAGHDLARGKVDIQGMIVDRLIAFQ